MDLTKDRAKLAELYQPGRDDFTLVDVPELPFAVIDGSGSPDHGAGADSIKNLYAGILPIRRLARERMGKDFVEAPLEMLYWADDMRDLATSRRDTWRWRAMITLPAWADEVMLEDSVDEARRHSGAMSGDLRFERFAEGHCAQIMHVGTAEDIPGLLHHLYTQFLPQRGMVASGPWHEIYLDDWTRAAPERRKLILRQPVR